MKESNSFVAVNPEKAKKIANLAFTNITKFNKDRDLCFKNSMKKSRDIWKKLSWYKRFWYGPNDFLENQGEETMEERIASFTREEIKKLASTVSYVSKNENVFFSLKDYYNLNYWANYII